MPEPDDLKDLIGDELEALVRDAADGAGADAGRLAQDLARILSSVRAALLDGDAPGDLLRWARAEAYAVTAQHALRAGERQRENLRERVTSVLAFAVRLLASAA